MEYKEVQSKQGKSVYVSVDREMIRTVFDTGVTKAELQYHGGAPTEDNLLYEVKAELSREFIDDSYHLRGPLTDEAKLKACLDLGVRAYEEKGDSLQGVEIIQGEKADARLRYIPRIDMKPVNS